MVGSIFPHVQSRLFDINDRFVCVGDEDAMPTEKIVTNRHLAAFCELGTVQDVRSAGEERKKRGGRGSDGADEGRIFSVGFFLFFSRSSYRSSFHAERWGAARYKRVSCVCVCGDSRCA